ncbi:YlbF family regulator [Mangrovibacillus cuniculi]|uniref:YlbF family regulator n=1 Tax=Mangrovibacillus cuniculi TaxID=2593652 RepID=A0A7S8CA64_9BACI|nr:YlbF family regulator [Mangrovibacillus cuniculi]QPC46229.1 YlbF family regulator [Mangrovibacillus cuniculi]
MLATMERLEVLDTADALAEAILSSDIVEEYRLTYKELKTNKETQKKVKAFMYYKERYEEVVRFGKYHPDYKEVMKRIREVKREMDMDDCVAAFRRAETDLQQLLDEISVKIGHSVSKGIKVPTGNPFWDSGGCSGGCSTGGSCGCSA